METIFDHNVTDEELESLRPRKILGLPPITKEEYLQDASEHYALVHIFHLYKIRGDKEKAQHYYDLIPDNEEDKMWYAVDCFNPGD